MGRGFMSFDEIFIGEYSNDKGVLKALRLFAENYARINTVADRRLHNRNAFSLLREIFHNNESCDEERIRTCYRYYLDERENILNRVNYQGDLI